MASLGLLCACVQQNKKNELACPETELRNPVLPGYFADPSIVVHEGRFYMYVTADPWGTDFLSCWVSDDFRNWTFHQLNWPTKAQCTSPVSSDSKVWAPSVVQRGGSFYMYVSVGSEVWCGKAEHPLGPWKNMLGDKQLIPYDTTKFYHVIDAEAFVDDDGKAYLYWGSGWNWTNGHCYVAELGDDMCSFRTEPKEVTPAHYFEGPWMLKRGGKYFLTYSDDKTIDETYKVRYAVGDNPFGPFTEGENSPILAADTTLQVYGPGHHTVLHWQGKDYIVYHRHRLPFVMGTALRQVCINELKVDAAQARIERVAPLHTQLLPAPAGEEVRWIPCTAIEASSEAAGWLAAANAADDSYATRWEPADDDPAPSIACSFAENTQVGTVELRMEYAWKTYYVRVEYADEEGCWHTAADYMEQGVSGSPIHLKVGKPCKQVRLVFGRPEASAKPAVWEVRFGEE